MVGILSDIGRALVLIVTGDAEVWRVTTVSLRVSAGALVLATLAGVPLGYAAAVSGHRVLAVSSWLLHALTALPTVVVGLGLYFVLSASGPLGWLDVLYTRIAMLIGQFVLATPIVAALVLTAIRHLPREAHETVVALGLGRMARMRTLVREARAAVVSAVLVSFGRVFTELGAAIILGGNIRGRTRTLTTVVALEYNKGDDARAMAMGVILLVVALVVTGVAHTAEARRQGEPA